MIELNANSMHLKKSKGETLSLEWNSAVPCDFSRVMPRPIVVMSFMNSEHARMLLDTGLLLDFVTPAFVEHLGLKMFPLAKQISLNLAVKGSHAKISTGCIAEFEYQEVREQHYFDLAVMNYDVILGTPFLFQHKVHLSMNPTKVMIGSMKSLPLDPTGSAEPGS